MNDNFSELYKDVVYETTKIKELCACFKKEEVERMMWLPLFTSAIHCFGGTLLQVNEGIAFEVGRLRTENECLYKKFCSKTQLEPNDLLVIQRTHGRIMELFKYFSNETDLLQRAVTTLIKETLQFALIAYDKCVLLVKEGLTFASDNRDNTLKVSRPGP